MFEKFKKLLGIEPPARVGVTKALHLKLVSLEPGYVMVLVHEDGSEFCVMHKDDFDHVASLANLKAASVERTP